MRPTWSTSKIHISISTVLRAQVLKAIDSLPYVYMGNVSANLLRFVSCPRVQAHLGLSPDFYKIVGHQFANRVAILNNPRHRP